MGMKAPPTGWTTPAEVIRVIDGDTIEVELRRRFPVRLIDPDNPTEIFDMPERNTTLGHQIKQYLVDLLFHQGNEVILHIPAGKKPIEFTDINSFNRILGAIWINGESLAKKLKEKLEECQKKDNNQN